MNRPDIEGINERHRRLEGPLGDVYCSGCTLDWPCDAHSGAAYILELEASYMNLVRFVEAQDPSIIAAYEGKT